MPLMNTINFTLHGEEHNVNLDKLSPEITLLEYLRDYENLKDTKYMCLEGGCGACVVAVTTMDPNTNTRITFAVNSCLVSLYSCQDWSIHTTNGIGNQKIGYHIIQTTLGDFNGTQCGYCSAGMVMNMYALSESNNLTMREVEKSFGGNICRCTGYRSILTAFKSLAKDADSKILGELPDIENLSTCIKNGDKCEKKCKEVCKKKYTPSTYFNNPNSKWYKTFSVNEIIDIFNKYSNSTYQLVAGNTARGVYPIVTYPDIYIDITSIADLKDTSLINNTLIIGANMTLNNTIQLFRSISKINALFAYLDKLADHLELVAHIPVRNIGTLAGNLSIKHENKDFPSDIFLILETIGARLTIVNNLKVENQYNLEDYLSLDMKKKVIRSISLPGLGATYNYGSFKIMPRAQNAHAMVNAGFLLNIENGLVTSARMVYGGINPTFVHAINAEKYLINKNIFDNTILQNTYNALNTDINPDDVLPQPSPQFRKQLAISLFYKFILSIAPIGRVSPQNRSGSQLISVLTRPISSGAQDYETNESLYPLTQPLRKVEARLQTAGETEYISDIPYHENQLFASFVQAKAIANSVIAEIDPSAALKLEGVVAFYDKDDIPGRNTFISRNINYPFGFIPPNMQIVEEELFCSGVVQFYNQPVGIIVAVTQQLADKAVDLVKITYTASDKKPFLKIRDILAANATDRIINEATLERVRTGDDEIAYTVKGAYDSTWQYHFHMETQNCLVVPSEDGFDIYPGSQWVDLIGVAVAGVLNLNENKLNIFIRRLGGAFGAKITRNSLIACATALAAYKLNKPVKMRMNLQSNMDIIGKRFPTAADYEVRLNSDGLIQYLDCTFYLDYATGGNEPFVRPSLPTFYGSYKHDTWRVSGNNIRTDNHASCWTRAPGHTNIFAMIESIMEQIALEMNKSSYEIRRINMDLDDDLNNNVYQFMSNLMQKADYDNRLTEINTFNQENRWIKKGLSLVPLTYGNSYGGTISVSVAVFAGDASVALTHGGIEIGQGMNTKVTQACAYTLGIPVELISVKPSNNMNSPNNMLTGGSFTTEMVCFATVQACRELQRRMEPVRQAMGNPTWQELVRRCQEESVDLGIVYSVTGNNLTPAYTVYGACISEVEVDILTGIHQVTRVDLLEDAGRSMNPLIDIGQLEGAFIMGLGFWTTEEIIFDNQGKLLTNRTWTYKPPGALDIPIDFRVQIPKPNSSNAGVLGAKATGEPSLCLSCSIPLAIRRAVASARATADPTTSKWYPFNGPSTVENTFMNSLNDYRQYKL